MFYLPKKLYSRRLVVWKDLTWISRQDKNKSVNVLKKKNIFVRKSYTSFDTNFRGCSRLVHAYCAHLMNSPRPQQHCEKLSPSTTNFWRKVWGFVLQGVVWYAEFGVEYKVTQHPWWIIKLHMSWVNYKIYVPCSRSL